MVSVVPVVRKDWVVQIVRRRNGQHRYEPSQESLWWTSTYAQETEGPTVVETVSTRLVTPFVQKFDLLGYKYKRSWKCDAGSKKNTEESQGFMIRIVSKQKPPV